MHCRGWSSTATALTCVVQIGTAGMELLKPHIREAVIEVFGCETLVFKNDSGARELEGLPSYVETVKGNAGEAGAVREGGLAFEVPLIEGQKTGWFFDQAFNRSALTKYVSRERAGARCVQLRRCLGRAGGARRGGRGHLRRQLGRGARVWRPATPSATGRRSRCARATPSTFSRRSRGSVRNSTS